MKPFKISAYLFGMAFIGVGVAMGLTNPDKAAYDDYAIDRFDAYLRSNVCTQAPSIFGNILENACVSLVDDNQSQIRELISENTERQNYWVLSIYETDLAVDQLLSIDWLDGSLPAYQFKTVGVFQRFYTYEVKQQNAAK